MGSPSIFFSISPDATDELTKSDGFHGLAGIGSLRAGQEGDSGRPGRASVIGARLGTSPESPRFAASGAISAKAILGPGWPGSHRRGRRGCAFAGLVLFAYSKWLSVEVFLGG